MSFNNNGYTISGSWLGNFSVQSTIVEGRYNYNKLEVEYKNFACTRLSYGREKNRDFEGPGYIPAQTPEHVLKSAESAAKSFGEALISETLCQLRKNYYTDLKKEVESKGEIIPISFQWPFDEEGVQVGFTGDAHDFTISPTLKN